MVARCGQNGRGYTEGVRRILLAASALVLLVPGCDKPETATPADAAAPATPEAPAADAPAAEVVKNVDAQPGDTTTCPYSGRPFVVKAEHPQVEYEGETYWVCSEEAAEKVRADPAKYLDGFDG